MERSQRTYVPAARHHWALPLYDPLVKLIGGDGARRALVDQAALQPAHRVLDIGCGTGTLVTLIKRLHPQVEAVGLDPDPKALARGERKAARAAVSVQFDRGFSDALPYTDASFDRVFSSFMFHLLERHEKEVTLREARRVLRPGGSLHMLAGAFPVREPHDGKASSRGRSARFGQESNAQERIFTLLRQADFADPRTVGRALMFGWVVYFYYKASVPI